MKVLFIVCVTLVWILAASVCYANLGDTLELCTTRFGKPVPAKDNSDPDGMGDSMVYFQAHGYDIGVVFIKGVVESEGFSKSDDSPLSDSETKSLLHADSAGWAWAKSVDPKFSETWIRTDGAVAFYDDSGHCMVLESKSFEATLEAKKAGKKQDK